MPFINKLNLLDFDMYSTNINIYYKYKEKIGSKFGLILTSLYSLISFTLFCYYTIIAVSKKKITFYESKIYSIETPSINITNSELYLAIGVENPITLEPFIDETIYYVKAMYKTLNLARNTSTSTELKIKKCDPKNFGEDYQHLIKTNAIENSYCLDDINLNLAGSFIYDKMSFIQILIYPCVNNTENNNHCKSKNVIDKYLEENYISIILKDLGINPYNYTSPILPSIQNLYASIGKSFFKEYSIFYSITEIQTDKGLLFDDIHKEKYIKFEEEKQNFYLFNSNKNLSETPICRIEIKLNDNIHVQRRTYMKMTEVFTMTGGYLQLLNTIFSLLSYLYKKLNVEKTLVNGLFRFDLDNQKIIIRIKYKDFLNYYQNNGKKIVSNYTIQNSRKSLKNNIYENTNSIYDNTYERNINKIGNKNSNEIKFNIIKEDKENCFKDIKLNENDGISCQNNNKRTNSILINRFENSEFIFKNAMNNINSNLKNINKNKSFMFRKNNDKLIKNVDFNLFQYLCCKICINKINSRNIALFNECITFYKNQMDIINIFNLLLLLKEHLKKDNKKLLKNQLNEEVQLTFSQNLKNNIS